METCSECRETFSEEIITFPDRSRNYPKRPVTALGLAYPLRYYQCKHCKAFYGLDAVTNEYRFVEGKMPYGIV